LSGQAVPAQTLVIYGDSIDWVGPTAQSPAMGEVDTLIDYSDCFVMPGMVDCHAHISYGNALTQEDIDLYASMEFRALRSMVAAQAILKSGFTSIIDPACSGMVAPAVRDAVNVGLFQGPRITASGRALTTQQGLYDWYPQWIGVPEASTGVMTTSLDQAIGLIRQQAKDGVDAIKLTMDGIHARRNGGGLIAAYTQAETHAMVDEIHRLGKLAVVHARGREGALYSARAGVDIIYHASSICDDGIQAALDKDVVLCPSLALLVTFIAITVYRFVFEERQRQYTRRAFQQYVSPEVVERIMQNPQALQFGGELRTLTVLFSDIRDFTTFTEKHDPQLVVQMLREYLMDHSNAIADEGVGGTLRYARFAAHTAEYRSQTDEQP